MSHFDGHSLCGLFASSWSIFVLSRLRPLSAKHFAMTQAFTQYFIFKKRQTRQTEEVDRSSPWKFCYGMYRRALAEFKITWLDREIFLRTHAHMKLRIFCSSKALESGRTAGRIPHPCIHFSMWLNSDETTHFGIDFLLLSTVQHHPRLVGDDDNDNNDTFTASV